MKVRIIMGASNAYACITGETYSMDVLLHRGRGAVRSLRESASENREKAARLLLQAERMEQAADILTNVEKVDR